MRVKILGGLVIFAWCFLFALVCVGQTIGISGKYEGSADVQPFGKLILTGEIREKDGKLSGVIITPLGDTSIVEGSFKNGNLTLKLDAGGDDIYLSGKLGADGKISGEIKSLSANGTFELKRVGDAAPEVDSTVITSQSKENGAKICAFSPSKYPNATKTLFIQLSGNNLKKPSPNSTRKFRALATAKSF
jgi:hypothetical protein